MILEPQFIQRRIDTTGLVCHLKLHDGTTFDHSLNGNDGTVSGTTYSYTYPGLDLAGADEHIAVADDAVFTPILTPFSFSAWIYMHSLIDFKIASKGVLDTDGEWAFHINGGTAFSVYYDESVNNCYIGRYGTNTVAVNTWGHFCSTYSGGTTNASVKIYLNGIRIDDNDNEANAASFAGVEAQSHAVWIGRYDAVYANGLIDDVMIFTVEKSVADILSIYSQTRGRYGV